MPEPQMHVYVAFIKWVGKTLLNPTSGLNFLTLPQNVALPVGNRDNERNIIFSFRRTLLELLEN
jgi:hypothetical protein